MSAPWARVRGLGSLPFAVSAAALLVAEAAAALLLTASERHEVLGGDGPEYGRYASNLLDHGIFTADVAEPLEPSVGRAPGYPVVLAAIRLVGGASQVSVRVFQFALLGLIAALVYRIALRLGSRLEACVAALLVLTYLPLVWFARFQLTEIVAAVLITAVVGLLVGRSAFGLWRAAGIGVLLGAAALVRPSYAPLAVLVAMAVLVSGEAGARWRRNWRPAAVILIACAFTLGPWVVRNAVTADRLIGLGPGGGVSLYASMGQWAGTISPAFTERDWTRFRAGAATVAAPVVAAEQARESGVPLLVREQLAADRAFKAEARELFSDMGPGDVAWRLPRRILYLWAPADVPPAATYANWHRVAQLQHGVVALLVLAGMLVLGRRGVWRTAWPLLLPAVYLTALHLVFHVEGRYTLPARAVLMALAAVGLVAVVRRATGRGARAGAGPMPAAS